MNELIKIEDLSVFFGEREVLKDIHLSLSPGQTLGIVGESGSGKSLTCLSIMGLLPDGARVASGAIHTNFAGEIKDVIQLEEHQLRKLRGKRISLIFQEPFSALNPVMKCGAQIMEAVELHLDLSRQEAKDHIFQLLRRVGLDDTERIYNAYPHQLSGGQLQRVLIAMSLSCHPDVIIADEPTTALDVTVQKNVLKLFKEIQEEFGCAIIFISHDLGVIREVADDVIVMEKGHIVEHGSIEEVFNSPRAPYTKGLLACRPPIKKRLKYLPVVADYINNVGKTYPEITREDQLNRNIDLQSKPPIISSQDIEVRYPANKTWWGKVKSWTHAVHPTKIAVYPGETLGLVGESGSGKSSLGKALLRLNDYATGSVLFEGQNIYDLSNSEMRQLRKSIQIIFQDPYSTLNPKLKVGKAIQEVLDVHKIGKDKNDRKNRTIELMEICGLEADHYDRYPHQFSGGQRQRISIARTLAVRPDFVVCDESVSALDVSVQAQILNLLKDLQKRFGLSYLFISHDLSVIRHLCDRILVMHQGKIVESGDPYDLFDRPKTDYTRSLIEAIPGIDYF